MHRDQDGKIYTEITVNVNYMPAYSQYIFSDLVRIF